MARYVLSPLLVGLLAYFLVGAYGMFHPTHVGWLQHSDLAQSYYGWAFYRRDPMTLPFGANPSYGMDFHSSVYYSDSIPLVAMLLKPFATLLPEPFQYFGIWVLLCFVLQAWFAQLVLGIVIDSAATRAIASILFVLAPPLLLRLGGHMALVGQWALLAALYLYLRPSEKNQRSLWTLLVALSIVIHAYIFFMVAAIWFADVVRRWYTTAPDRTGVDPLRRRTLLVEVIQVLMVTVAVAWFAGFFMVAAGGWKADGFGIYKMNLLAIVDGAGWSSFGLNFPISPGEYEGFNYLGAGGLALCVVAVAAWWRWRRKPFDGRAVWPLVLVCIVFTLLAITHHVGLGDRSWNVPLSAKLQQKLSHLSLQATGRLFWVPYYLILIATLFTLARSLPKRVFVVILIAAVAVQMADLRTGLENLRHLLTARATTNDAASLQGPFWAEAGSRYTRLRLIPSRVLAPGWEILARYAFDHHMQTDAIQVARVDWRTFFATSKHQVALLTDGEADPKTLYIVDPSEITAVAHGARQSDAFFSLDGWNVLAPDWGSTLPIGAKNLKESGS
jgi:hypothetical protein